MIRLILRLFIILSIFLTGCGRLDFGDSQGLTYYEPTPYLFVTISKDCATTANVIMIPAKKKILKFKTGYGSADLSVNISNGMITSVGQKTDTKVPETITSIAALGTAIGTLKTVPEPDKKDGCTPTATLYPINDKGEPDTENPLIIPVIH